MKKNEMILKFEQDKVRWKIMHRNHIQEFQKYIANYLITAYEGFNQEQVKILKTILLDMEKIISSLAKEEQEDI